MFQKIHYAFYDMLFEIYGAFAEYYSDKLKDEWTDHVYYERKLRKCIEKREDILEIMFVLKGLY